MPRVESQGDVAAQREAADDRTPYPEVDEKGAHVGHGVGGGVASGVIGAVRLAVAPHVPGDHLRAIREGEALAVPHAPGGAEAV